MPATFAPTQPPAATSAPQTNPEPVYVAGSYKGLTGKSYTDYPLLKTERELYEIDHIIWEVTRSGMSNLEKARAVHDWLVKNIRYDTSYSSYHIDTLLATRSAVCQGYAEFYAVALSEMGMQARVVTGTAQNSSSSGTESHAWNAVKMDDGKWYFVDVTWDDPMINGHSNYPDGSNMSMNYFMITNEAISVNHFTSGSTGLSPLGTSLTYHDQAADMRYADLKAGLIKKIADEGLRFAYIISSEADIERVRAAMLYDVHTTTVSEGYSFYVFIRPDVIDPGSALIGQIVNDVVKEAAKVYKTGVGTSYSKSGYYNEDGPVRNVYYYTVSGTVSKSS